MSTTCESDGYVGKNGVRKTGKRSKTIGSHWWCRRAWLLTIIAPNAAERHRNYLVAQVYKHEKVSCEQFCQRMVELNNYMKLLPCWKDEEDSPSQLARADTPFTSIEMCMHILNALPFPLATAYWAMKGAKHCPVDVDELRRDLILVEPNVKSFAKLVAQVKSQGNDKGDEEKATAKGGKANSGGGTASSKSSTKGSGGKTQNQNPRNTQRKLCNRCAQWSAYLKNTHNTKDCRKWNNDSTPKNKRTRETQAISKEMEEQETCFAQLKAEHKKMKKMLGKKLSKANKKQKTFTINVNSSSDDSSDSE